MTFSVQPKDILNMNNNYRLEAVWSCPRRFCVFLCVGSCIWPCVLPCFCHLHLVNSVPCETNKKLIWWSFYPIASFQCKTSIVLTWFGSYGNSPAAWMGLLTLFSGKFQTWWDQFHPHSYMD